MLTYSNKHLIVLNKMVQNLKNLGVPAIFPLKCVKIQL